MSLLLDTHILLWWLADDPVLKPSARALVADPVQIKVVSAASIWEIRIKQGLGKLALPERFQDVLDAEPFIQLPITPEHAHKVVNLPHHHRDPFDRMLISQAQVEGLAIISHDRAFSHYDVQWIAA